MNTMSNKKVRTLSLLLAVLVAVSVPLCLNVSAEEDRVVGDYDGYVTYPEPYDVRSFLLLETQTESVLCSYGADRTVYPTSLAKLMTVYLSFSSLRDRMEEKVELTSGMLAGVIGHRLGLKAGEEVTVSDLLHGLAVGGYNDCAQVLAFLCSGSVSSFVERMNETARGLGMEGTLYTNPTGLHDPDMVTTARDCATLCLRLCRDPQYLEMAALPFWVMPETNLSVERRMINRNDLVTNYRTNAYYDPACRGLNAGMTDEGGCCTAAIRARPDSAGYDLCLVFGGEEKTEGHNTAYLQAKDLFAFSSASFSWKILARAGQEILKLPVGGSLDDSVPVGVREDARCFLPNGEKAQGEVGQIVRLCQSEFEAPLSAGSEVGKIRFVRGETVLATADLVVLEDREPTTVAVLFGFLKKGETNRGFLLSVAFFAFLSAGLFVLWRIWKKRRSGLSRFK